MKWELSLPKFSTLLHYWVKLTGLSPFTVIGNKFYQSTNLYKFYAVILATSSCFLFSITTFVFRVLRPKSSHNYSELTSKWMIFYSFCSTATVTSSLIVFLTNRNNLVRLGNQLCSINDELRSLISVEIEGNFLRKISIVGLIANVGLIAGMFAIGFIEQNWSVLMIVKYVIESWSVLNMILIFAGIMLYVEQRFVMLNQNLSEACQASARKIGWPQLRHSRILVAMVNPRVLHNRAWPDSFTDFERIRKIESLHLQLCDVIDQTTNLFKISIMFYILRSFCVLVTCSFWMYSSITTSIRPRDTMQGIISFFVDYILLSAVKIIIVTSELLIIAHASSRVCKQGNATRTILSKVWLNFKQSQLRDEVLMFSTQLLHKAVSVSVFGFFNLNYSFVSEVFGKALIYFIVTVQFLPLQA